jgi:hypothetical protein
MAGMAKMQQHLKQLQNMRKKLETGHGVAKQQGDTKSRLEWVNEQIKMVRDDIKKYKMKMAKSHPGHTRSSN